MWERTVPFILTLGEVQEGRRVTAGNLAFRVLGASAPALCRLLSEAVGAGRGTGALIANSHSL